MMEQIIDNIMPAAEGQDRLWKKKDVAAFMQVSHRTIEDWILRRRVKIPYIKLNGSIRFIPADIKQFVAGMRVKGGAR